MLENVDSIVYIYHCENKSICLLIGYKKQFIVLSG